MGYFRRWLTHFTTTDNTAVTAADFNSFSLNAPSDPAVAEWRRLSDLGSVQRDLGGIRRAPANNVTFADNFGGQTQVYNGVLVNVSARAANGLTLQGGINTGKTVNDYCNVRAQLPELSLGFAGSIVGPTNPYCLVDPGFVTKITGLGSYTLPKVDVLIAGTFRSDQGAPLRATWNAPVALVSAALGRPAAVAGTTVPIDLVAARRGVGRSRQRAGSTVREGAALRRHADARRLRRLQRAQLERDPDL